MAPGMDTPSPGMRRASSSILHAFMLAPPPPLKRARAMTSEYMPTPLRVGIERVRPALVTRFLTLSPAYPEIEVLP